MVSRHNTLGRGFNTQRNTATRHNTASQHAVTRHSKSVYAVSATSVDSLIGYVIDRWHIQVSIWCYSQLHGWRIHGQHKRPRFYTPGCVTKYAAIRNLCYRRVLNSVQHAGTRVAVRNPLSEKKYKNLGKFRFASCRINLRSFTALEPATRGLYSFFSFQEQGKKPRPNNSSYTRIWPSSNSGWVFWNPLLISLYNFIEMTELGPPSNLPSTSDNKYQDTFLCTSEFDPTGFYQPTYYLFAHEQSVAFLFTYSPDI